MRDLVPAELRAQWAAAGYYAGRDIYDLFAEHVRAAPERTAIVDDLGELSYAELDERVREVAVGLTRRGIRPGEIVATQLPNGRDTCVADLAIAAIGAVALPYPVGRGVRDAVLSSIDGLAGRAGDFRPVPIDPDGPARVLVSSGSEAEPKLVLYSHNALACGRGAFMARLIPDGVPLRALFLLPLASSFGSNGIVSLARHGGTLVLQSRFDAGAALRLIERARPTHLIGVPTMFRMMINHPELSTTDLSSLRVVAPGGAQLDAETAAACRKAFGAIVVNVYGSADGVNCHTALDDPPSRVTTAGRPNPAVAEIRVVDGEIIARGPMSPMCYLGDEELNTRYRTPDGWVRTGDLGVFDADGYLTVVGRRKDVVIRGGANISPAEVERAIAGHPAVRDVACVGVPDELMGERLCACVVTSGEVTLDDLGGFLAAQGIERFKHPERLLRLDSLPLNPAGKVAKDVLRDFARA